MQIVPLENSLEGRIWHFMQILPFGDNFHEVSNPIFQEMCILLN